MSSTHAPRREVVQAEALAWLAANPASPGSAIVTSLPDAAELPELDFQGWRAWFIRAARAVIAWLPADGVAIFYQSDVRRGGVWVDKAHLVLTAADGAGAVLAWHRIVCREPPGSATSGRASYSHLLCLCREISPAYCRPGIDVLPDAGPMPTANAMGADAARLACRFIAEHTRCRHVVDPFCGRGTVLAAANESGLDATGVDVKSRCVSAARKRVLAP